MSRIVGKRETFVQFGEYLTPFFKRLPLTELTWDRMQAVVEGQKGDKAPATRNRYYQLLRSILRRAMREWNWIDSVPTIRLHREPEGRVRYLTPTEIDTFLRNLPEHLRSLTRFTIATGLRRANVLCLKWSQIDMQRQVMNVAASDIKSRKTLGIPLNATAMEILRAQIGQHQGNGDGGRHGLRQDPRHKSVTLKSKGLASNEANPLISLAPRPGLEPGTYGLTGDGCNRAAGRVIAGVSCLERLFQSFRAALSLPGNVLTISLDMRRAIRLREAHPDGVLAGRASWK